MRDGLVPQKCFSGVPKTREQFLDRCGPPALPNPGSRDECLSFDNCSVLPYLCPDAAGAEAGGPPPLVGPPTPLAGPPIAVAPAADDSTLPACQDASQGRDEVVYLSGSTNFLSLLGKLAPIVNELTGLTPVFKITDSCTGARSMYRCTDDDDPSCKDGFRAQDHFIADPPKGSGAAHAKYFDAAGPHDCLLGGSTEVDVGESEVFAETCELARDDTRVRHTPGPILPILFVVPRYSRQSVISAEAAREVFGNGGNVKPWVDPSFFYVRGPNTATTRLIGRAIDVKVPPNTLWGIDKTSAQNLASSLRALTDPFDADRAIGLLGADTYDADRTNLKALGFVAKGQTCAYVPDSGLSTFDKRNVRDGHYPIWGTLHFFTAVEATEYLSHAAEKFVTLFNLSPRPDKLLDALIDASWIPECAMEVENLSDLSDPTTSNPPPDPCGCYFDRRVMRLGNDKLPPGCVPCVTNDDCTQPNNPLYFQTKHTCSYHFCAATPL